MKRNDQNRKPPRPAWQPTFTIAERLLESGQRLRADETLCVATFTIRHAALHALRAMRCAAPLLAVSVHNARLQEVR